MSTDLIPTNVKHFGIEYCFQGVFTSAAEMKANKAAWAKLGHKAIVKKKDRLYVTRFQQ